MGVAASAQVMTIPSTASATVAATTAAPSHAAPTTWLTITYFVLAVLCLVTIILRWWGARRGLSFTKPQILLLVFLMVLFVVRCISFAENLQTATVNPKGRTSFVTNLVSNTPLVMYLMVCSLLVYQVHKIIHRFQLDLESLTVGVNEEPAHDGPDGQATSPTQQTGGVADPSPVPLPRRYMRIQRQRWTMRNLQQMRAALWAFNLVMWPAYLISVTVNQINECPEHKACWSTVLVLVVLTLCTFVMAVLFCWLALQLQARLQNARQLLKDASFRSIASRQRSSSHFGSSNTSRVSGRDSSASVASVSGTPPEHPKPPSDEDQDLRDEALVGPRSDAGPEVLQLPTASVATNGLAEALIPEGGDASDAPRLSAVGAGTPGVHGSGRWMGSNVVGSIHSGTHSGPTSGAPTPGGSQNVSKIESGLAARSGMSWLPPGAASYDEIPVRRRALSMHSVHSRYRTSAASSMLSYAGTHISGGVGRHSLVLILNNGQKILWFAAINAGTLVWRVVFLVFLIINNIETKSSKFSSLENVLYYIPSEVFPMTCLLLLYLAPVLEACLAERQRDDRDDESDDAEGTQASETAVEEAARSAAEIDAAASTALLASGTAAGAAAAGAATATTP